MKNVNTLSQICCSDEDLFTASSEVQLSSTSQKATDHVTQLHKQISIW